MWDVQACRSCLAVDCKLEKLSTPYKRIFIAVTGLEINDIDGFPKYLCTECHAQIKKCITFRRKARRAYFVLQEIVTIRKEISYKDIKIVDRVKTNLKSNLGYQKTVNEGCYSITDPEIDIAKNYENGKDVNVKQCQYESKDSKLIYQGLIPNNSTDEKHYPVEEINENLNQIIAQEVTLETLNYRHDSDDESERVNTKQFETIEVDINDVFKDLNEDNMSEIDDLESIKNGEIIETKTVVPNPMLGTLSTMQQNQCVKALVNSKIEFQTIAQQSNNFAIRMLKEPYFSSKFKCFICLKIFNNVNDLRIHVILHNEWSSGPYKCKICRNKFAQTEDLSIHQATNHWYKYTCKICGISEYTLLDITKHYLVHDEQKEDEKIVQNKSTFEDIKEYFNLNLLPAEERQKNIEKNSGLVNKYHCYKCNIGFEDYNKIVEHLKIHGRVGSKGCSHHCGLCDIWFANANGFYSHMRNMHTYQIECKLCSAVLCNRFQASHHYKTNHLKEDKEIKSDHKCLECNRIFTTKQGLARHMNLHSIQILPNEQCNVCGECFETPSQLYSHQLQTHQYISLNHPKIGSKQFLCKLCDIYFVSENAYQRHLLFMGHEEANQVPFACIPCKTIFNNDEELSQHTLSCVKYPRKCSYCDAILVNPVEYQKHYFRVHPNLEYKPTRGSLCELCGKSVASSKMKAHLQNHLQNNTLTCPYCKREFLTATNLFVHIVSFHTQMPYICGFCNRRFKFRGACRDHILKAHVLTKNFRCTICTKDFSTLKLLQHHSIKTHGVQKTLKFQVKKNKGNLYLYPNMKIDVSLVDPNLIQRIEAVLCDYLDAKSKLVKNIDNYLIRNEEIDFVSNIPFTKRNIEDLHISEPKKQKKRDDTASENSSNSKLKNIEYCENKIELKKDYELEEAIKNLEFDDSCIDTHGQMDVILEDTSQNVHIDESELEFIEKNDEEIEFNGILEDTSQNVQVDESESGVIEKNDEQYVQFGVSSEDSFQNIDVESELSIIEKNGEQYVTLNGVLYRIENSEEQ